MFDYLFSVIWKLSWISFSFPFSFGLKNNYKIWSHPHFKTGAWGWCPTCPCQNECLGLSTRAPVSKIFTDADNKSLNSTRAKYRRKRRFRGGGHDLLQAGFDLPKLYFIKVKSKVSVKKIIHVWYSSQFKIPVSLLKYKNTINVNGKGWQCWYTWFTTNYKGMQELLFFNVSFNIQ